MDYSLGIDLLDDLIDDSARVPGLFNTIGSAKHIKKFLPLIIIILMKSNVSVADVFSPLGESFRRNHLQDEPYEERLDLPKWHSAKVQLANEMAGS
mmetsp:Transcript_23063/g.47945  ORF Transcript_23063/g.47945 Transcript_23063/m.47945 type:complete len:96 (+) Transcript_23063:2083-2370(+)